MTSDRVPSTSMNQLITMFRRLAYRVWIRRIQDSLNRRDACRILGLDLVVTPGVLHPRHFASSTLLGEHIASLKLIGRQVADVGTGSGLLGLLAARSGADVTAIDISPAAVRCAQENAIRNGLEDRVNVTTSDVFSDVPAEKHFDLVITNPPFYPREASQEWDHAFAAGDNHEFMIRLATGLQTRLRPGGRLVMVHSSDTDFAPVSAILKRVGLTGALKTKRRGLFETLSIWEFRREPAG